MMLGNIQSLSVKSRGVVLRKILFQQVLEIFIDDEVLSIDCLTIRAVNDSLYLCQQYMQKRLGDGTVSIRSSMLFQQAFNSVSYLREVSV